MLWLLRGDCCLETTFPVSSVLSVGVVLWFVTVAAGAAGAGPVTASRGSKPTNHSGT